MFDKLKTPEDIFSFKLGAALTMEQTVLTTLQDLQKETKRDEIRAMLAQHETDTETHIANINRAFELLGEKPDDSPCPAIDGLAAEGKAALKMTKDEIKDAIVMSSVIETEHHEIAVYEVLVTNAEARGAPEVAQLLQRNLDNEKATVEAAKAEGGKLAHAGWAVA